jgi:hypothetical protein
VAVPELAATAVFQDTQAAASQDTLAVVLVASAVLAGIQALQVQAALVALVALKAQADLVALQAQADLAALKAQVDLVDLVEPTGPVAFPDTLALPEPLAAESQE